MWVNTEIALIFFCGNLDFYSLNHKNANYFIYLDIEKILAGTWWILLWILVHLPKSYQSCTNCTNHIAVFFLVHVKRCVCYSWLQSPDFQGKAAHTVQSTVDRLQWFTKAAVLQALLFIFNFFVVWVVIWAKQLYAFVKHKFYITS